MSSCKDQGGENCTSHIDLNDRSRAIISDFEEVDTLDYKITVQSQTDTIRFVKRSELEDVLKFEDRDKLTVSCRTSAELFLERHHIAYYSNSGDSIVFDIIMDYQKKPSLFIHYRNYSMAEGYNGCFFCNPLDSSIEVNGSLVLETHTLNGMVLSKKSTYDMTRCLGSYGRPVLNSYTEANSQCRGFYKPGEGLYKWTAYEGSDSMNVFELIH